MDTKVLVGVLFVLCVRKVAVQVLEVMSTSVHTGLNPVAYRGGLAGSTPPPPLKFRSFAKAEPNSQFRGIYIRNNLIRIWVSFICKLSGTPD
jgi:hypothetical protein